MKQKASFRHESLQDRDSVKRLLNALIRGIDHEKIVLEDDDGTLTMETHGMATLKITASHDDEKNRLNIRLTWQANRQPPVKKKIRIKSK